MFHPCFVETKTQIIKMNESSWFIDMNEIAIVCDLIICFRVQQSAITIEN